MRDKFNISRLALKFSHQTLAFWLAIVVAGIIALSSLKYALFPDISFPVLTITVGDSSVVTALETESKLTKPLEKSLQELPHLDEIYSITYPQQAVLNLLYKPGTAIETATQEVKQALLKNFPSFKTEVFAIDLNESPVITYALTSTRENLADLTEKDLIPFLEKVPGVLKVNLLGDSILPGRKFIPPRFPTLVRFQGKNALAVQVIKKSNANTLEVVSLVTQEIKQLSSKYSDIQFNLAETQAKFIQAATTATIEELFLAIILAVAVIFVFLGTLKATLIPALAIPTSLLATFTVMACFHFNLETLTLLALSMVIGIVVDDAIVDVENIARLIDQGQSPRLAVINGTNEIGLSVVASTLTIVAVFLPVGLMGGTVGQFFKPFGLTVSAAVLFSLLVARTLSPILALWWLKPNSKKASTLFSPDSSIVRLYERVLFWSLRHRRQVIAIALISFVAGIAFIPFIPKGFVPKLERGEFNIVYTVALPKINTIKSTPSSNDSSFNWIDKIAQSPEAFLLRRTILIGKKLEAEVLQIPQIESVLTIAGIRGEPNQGRIYLKIKQDSNLNTPQLQELIRKKLPQLKKVSISVEDIPFVQTEADKPLQLAIRGQDLIILAKTAQNIKNLVAKEPGFLDVALSNATDDVENPLKIERLSGTRSIYLSANLAPSLALEDAALKVEELAKKSFPPEIKLKRWGNSSHSEDVLASFGTTIALSTLLILLVLLILFRRLLEPLVIVLSLPLSIVGAMLGLWVTRSDFGIISLIGLIFLLGLLSKNSILLLDYTNQLRTIGKSREDALLESAKVRLRPIIMTTVATILGMIPITLGLGAGAELRQPMAVAIVGGLITSTLLSLIVVPVLYSLLEDAWNRFKIPS